MNYSDCLYISYAKKKKNKKQTKEKWVAVKKKYTGKFKVTK